MLSRTANLKRMTIGDMTQFGSMMAGVMFVFAMVHRWLPAELRNHFQRYFQRIISCIYPYITIRFDEYQVDDFERSVAYVAIDKYLSTHSSNGAKRLKANVVTGGKSFFLNMDDYEEVTDEFQGIQIWWSSSKSISDQRVLFTYGDNDEKRCFKLTFNRKHRDIITNKYLHHVLDEGKAIGVKTRPCKLYTNNKRSMWSHIMFEHPSTFDTLAMDLKKKNEILNDLMMFSKSKDYYKKVGKSWKRGYLLYCPPGTGKSSMIAAMSNFLEYDIYDLELTSVQDNTDLRKLLTQTSTKSIIVIEDIDCSLDLTGKRKKKNEDGQKHVLVQQMEEGTNKKGSSMTLSGLLNFIDGLWSACGSERLIVFTTNHVDKLDPALIRRGRMDMHIELSYCCFETFKFLAKNYLNIESHKLFATISPLLKETNMTPADVAENLMPKSAEENGESCLKNLIKSLENKKEEARIKADEELKQAKREKRFVNRCKKAMKQGIKMVMAISVISVSLDSLEDSVRTPDGRVILFETPIIAPTIRPSTNYTPASLDYLPASNSESDPSEDPSSDHIPPLPAISPFLSSADDTTESDTPPSPTHGMPFTEITSSTQRPPIIPRRRVMILSPRQPIPHGRPYRYHHNGPVHMMTARKRVGLLPTHRLAVRHSTDHSSSDSSSEASSDFHSDASYDSSSRHPLSDHSSPDLPITSAGPSCKR
ncbi:AAA-ATPase ASD, mitochondrial-like protein, partial [Tanacetum coccineum]